MGKVILIVHNVRSAFNVGSLFRSADGLGVSQVILSGYTPYPAGADDKRLPHIARRAQDQIHKTALDAEGFVKWRHADDILALLKKLKAEGYIVVALEQSSKAVPLNQFKTPAKIALIVGSEVGGLDQEILADSDAILEIPMRGRKESFNVAAAAAIALYHLDNLDKSTA